jgi:polyhydroxyalkanoate synthesis regulator phasin
MADRRSSRTSTARGSTARKSTARKTTARRSTSASRGGAGRSTASADRLDKSIENFRSSLERSVTLTRERIQEVVDDAVKRGRMTRGDAEEMVSKLVSRGRRQTDAMLKDLERLVNQTRREVDRRARPARRRATQAAQRARRQMEGATGRAARAARDAADRPLAEADRLRRRAGAPGFPITAYDQLTAAQVRSRLGDLSAADLRKVRTYEKRHANRKGVVEAIEKRLS